jgi:hypothetical protein
VKRAARKRQQAASRIARWAYLLESPAFVASEGQVNPASRASGHIWRRWQAWDVRCEPERRLPEKDVRRRDRYRFARLLYVLRTVRTPSPRQQAARDFVEARVLGRPGEALRYEPVAAWWLKRVTQAKVGPYVSLAHRAAQRDSSARFLEALKNRSLMTPDELSAHLKAAGDRYQALMARVAAERSAASEEIERLGYIPSAFLDQERGVGRFLAAVEIGGASDFEDSAS